MWGILEKTPFMKEWHSISTYSLEILGIKYRYKMVVLYFYAQTWSLSLCCIEPENRSVSPEKKKITLAAVSVTFCISGNWFSMRRHISVTSQFRRQCKVLSHFWLREAAENLPVQNKKSLSVWIILWGAGIIRIIMQFRIWTWISMWTQRRVILTL